MDLSIDSFAGVPLLATVAAGLVLFILLIMTKIRNTSKVSFVFYIAVATNIAGLLYAYLNRRLIYLVLTLLVSEGLLIIYAFVLAISDPKKRDEKKSKKSAEHAASEFEADAVARNTEKYNALIQITSDLTAKAAGFFDSEDALASFLGYFNKLIIEKTEADGGAILVLDEADNVLSVKSLEGSFPPPYKLPDDLPHKQIRVETNFKFAQFQLAGNAFGDIFSEGKPINIKNPAKNRCIFQNGPEEFLKCGPYLFLPLEQNGMTAALVCVARKPERDAFTEEEFETACNLTAAAATAMRPLAGFIAYKEHMELTKEGDIAAKFQKTVMPEKLPVISKLSIGKYMAAAENVCGDYYDVIPSRRDRITFVMADIAGKGMNSLVIMITIRAMIHLVANTSKSAATLLEWINHAICSEKNNMDHFASIALVNYNSIENTAQIATCGTNPVILYSAADKSIKKISVDGEPIGVEKNTKFHDLDISLNAGDIIVSCTDGLLECLNENGVQYSMDALMDVVKENSKLAGKDIANKVKDSVKKFCGNAQQYDDQSLLVVKIQG